MIILHLMQTNHFYDALKENVQGRMKIIKGKKNFQKQETDWSVTSLPLVTMFLCFVLLLWLLSYNVSLFCFITMATILLCFSVLFYYYGY
jgi:ABC-type proline/glycine betaine transport system permease subunit